MGKRKGEKEREGGIVRDELRWKRNRKEKIVREREIRKERER